MRSQRKFAGLVSRPAKGIVGQHYYGADCPSCGARIAVLKDASVGIQPVVLKDTGEMEVACPYCGDAEVHQVRNMLAFRQT